MKTSNAINGQYCDVCGQTNDNFDEDYCSKECYDNRSEETK